MPKIDWDFIGELEGGRHLTAYVPNAVGSDSGVTLGIGVDLGKVQPTELPLILESILQPYCGLKGLDAVAAIDAVPLTISSSLCDTLDAWAAKRIVDPVVYEWNLQSITNWSSVPDRLATVVVSVAYQYGEVWRRCPRFWGNAIEMNIPEVINELKNFGDAYPTRRHQEAAYLSSDETSVLIT